MVGDNGPGRYGSDGSDSMTDFMVSNEWVFLFLFLWLVGTAAALVLVLCRALLVRGAVRAEQRRQGRGAGEG